MDENHEQQSQEHNEHVDHHAAAAAPVATLTQMVTYTDTDGTEKAAIVSRVDGETVGLTVFDPYQGAVPRYIENVQHKEQNPEGGFWQ